MQWYPHWVFLGWGSVYCSWGTHLWSWKSCIEKTNIIYRRGIDFKSVSENSPGSSRFSFHVRACHPHAPPHSRYFSAFLCFLYFDLFLHVRSLVGFPLYLFSITLSSLTLLSCIWYLQKKHSLVQSLWRVNLLPSAWLGRDSDLSGGLDWGSL